MKKKLKQKIKRLFSLALYENIVIGFLRFLVISPFLFFKHPIRALRKISNGASRTYKKLTNLETYENTLIKTLQFLIKRSPLKLLPIRAKTSNGASIKYADLHPYQSASASLLTMLLVFGGAGYFLFNYYTSQASAWWNDDWHYRKSLTINSSQVTADLTDFPMLVSITDGDLATNAQADGDDIVFTLNQGNKLDHEIESFDSSTGTLVAWVRIPELDGDNDSTIYMYYGNPTTDNQQRPESVWDENFVMVQHLEETGTGTRADSTRNNNDGTTSGYDGDEATDEGKVNGADDFDGTDDYLGVSDNATINFGQNSFTSSTWFQTTATEDSSFMAKEAGGYSYGFALKIWQYFSGFVGADGSGNSIYIDTSSNYNDGAWHHGVFVVDQDNDTAELYIDGSKASIVKHTGCGTITSDTLDISSCSVASAINTETLYLLRNGYNSNSLEAIADELRLSSSARSADWISTEFNNQDDPAAFITVGVQEKGPGPVLYLPFDEGFGSTAHDESSAHNDATISGATWADESMCKTGKCLQFDGDDYLEIDDDNTLDLTNEMTMEAWVKPTSTDRQSQTIISKTETPDEPTKIYRSVGPGATTAITTGASNAMTITGTTAKFASALPTNVGVGDAIQYDDDNDSDIDANDSIAFISERISGNEFRVQSADGSTPTAVTADTDWGLFRAYISLDNASIGTENTGIDSDLRNFDTWTNGKDISSTTGSDEQWNITCYANGTTADSDMVSFGGSWTTSEQNFIRAYTPTEFNEVGVTQRHSGVWDNNKYHINHSSDNSPTVDIRNVSFVHIDGLQIETTSYVRTYTYGVQIYYSSGTRPEQIRISNNIIRDADTSSANHRGIQVSAATTAPHYFWNNIIYDFSGTSGTGISIDTDYGTPPSFIYNNTVHNTTTCFASGYEGNLFINNIGQSCTDGFDSGTYNSGTSHNIIEVNIADGAMGVTHSTGTTTSATASKLVDSGATFITDGVQVGSIVEDTSNTQYSYVTAIDSETQLSVNDDIFTNGEAYSVYTNKYGNVTFENEGSDDFRLDQTDTFAIDQGVDLSADADLAFTTDIEGDSRISNFQFPISNEFDIGADEYEPTGIYRSVGPGSTSALATGESNPMTITGDPASNGAGIATFTEALADNIGVGDAIQYDDDDDGDIDSNDSIVFIHKRFSNYKFQIKNSSGGDPVEVSQDTDWSLYRAYTSLSNAESGTENTGIDSDLRNFDTFTDGKDIVTSGEQWNIACYGDAADTTAVSISGWTTGANNYIRVYTPVRTSEVGESQRHEGIWDDGKYNMEVVGTNWGACIRVYENYVRVEGLQCYVTYADVGQMAGLQIDYISTFGSDVRFSENIIKRETGNYTNGWIGIYQYEGIMHAWNNIIYDFDSSDNVGINANRHGGGEAYVYNNTIENTTLGIQNTSGTVVIKNNTIKSSGTDYSGTFDSASAYNVGDNSAQDGAFGATWSTGTTDGTTASKLVHSIATFQTDGVQVGSIIKNTTDTTYTYVTAVDSETTLSINDDIFVSGEGYEVYTNIYGSVDFVDESGDDFHLDTIDTVALGKGIDLSSDPYLPFTTDIDGDTREGSWSIGADEGTPTKIYRSVGPGNTEPLETGEDNDMTITPASNGAGGIATFDEALPDRIGVGDAIQYDDDGDGDIDSSDSIAFISGRISASEFSVQSASGATPTAVSADNDWSIFRAYTSLANAESGTENTGIDSDLVNFDTWSGGKDIATSGEQWNIACYGDAVDTATTTTTISGWTTDEDSYIRIYTPTQVSEVGTSQRHEGVWDNSKYRMFYSSTGEYAHNLYIQAEFTRIDGLQIERSGTTNTNSSALNIGSLDEGTVYISNNIIKSTMIASSGHAYGINLMDANSHYQIWNNIIYGFSGIGESYCIRANFIKDPSYIYNNTIYDCGTGVYTYYSERASVINNIVQDSTDGFSGTFASSSDFNISDLAADAPGSHSKNSTNVTFLDESGDDFRLSTSDTAARGAGINLYNDSNLPVTTDIEGDQRPNPSDTSASQSAVSSAAYDIGADQTISKETKVYSMSVANSAPKVEYNDSQFSTGQYTLEANRWNHLVYKRDSSNEYLFINGTQRDSGTISDFLKTNSGKLYIGSQNDNSDNSFQGFIDEVRIYNYARTEDEIKKDTAQGSSGKAAARAEEGIAVSIGDSNNFMGDGLVGYWKMDESSWNGTTGEVLDYSGNNNHGTAADNATTAAGKYGSGGTFDGTGDYVDVESNVNAGGSFSVSAWAYADDDTLYNLLGIAGVKYGYVDNPAFIMLYRDRGDTDRFYVYIDDEINFGEIPNNGCYQNWCNYSFTYESNGNLEIYINGENAGNFEVSSGIEFDSPINIGQTYNGNGEWFDGKIDEVRIYNRALDPLEVRQLYKWAPGPVAHWKMDEKVAGDAQTLYDISGNENHGTTEWGANASGMDCTKPGKYGSACEFDGTDDYIDVGSNSELNFTKNMTISAWIEPYETEMQGYTIVSFDDTNNWYLYQYETALFFRYTDTDTNTQTLDFGSFINEDELIHLAVTYSDSSHEGKVYVNGTFQSSDTGTQDMRTSSWDDLLIGIHNTSSNDRPFNGLIDDVRLYNYIRTQDQIIEDMNAGHPVGGSPVGSQVAYWKFDEGVGGTAYDSVGDNDGTLTPGTGGDNDEVSEMWSLDGKYGKAIEFDGTDDYVDMGTGLVDGWGAITVSLWVKHGVGESSTRQRPIEQVDYGMGPIQIYREAFNETYSFYLLTTAGGDGAVTDIAFPDTNWHHVVGTWDGSIIQIYVDVTNTDSTPASLGGTFSPSANILSIGSNDSTDNWDGLIDEVKIYNTALTAEQVRTEYNMGKAMVMGQPVEHQTGATGQAMEYCVPGDTSTCDAPVLELKMDEMSGTTAFDTSGNGNDGAFSNPTWNPIGKIGSALNFSGGGNVTVSDDSTLHLTDFTINMWYKVSDWNRNFFLISKRDLFTTQDWSLNYSDVNDKFSFAIGESDAGIVFSSLNYNPNDDQWHHMSIIKNGTNYSLYGDGTLIGTDTSSTTWTESDDIHIGGGAFNMVGMMDEVRIYDYERTPAQIAWDFNRGKPIGWWKMDGVSGTQVDDWSGNANHGTMTNMDPATDWVDGKFGGALDFDGGAVRGDDYVDMNDISIWDDATEMSGCAWVKSNYINFAYIFQKHDGNSGFYLYRDDVGSTSRTDVYGIRFYRSGYGSARVESRSGAAQTTSWDHVCYTFVENTTNGLRLYVNGVEDENSPDDTTGEVEVVNVTSDFTISGSTNQFSGQIDDVRIWNYALTPLQIKEVMNNGAVSFR